MRFIWDWKELRNKFTEESINPKSMIFRVIFCNILVFVTVLLHASDSTLTWTQWKETWPVYIVNAKSIEGQNDSNEIRSIEVLDMRSDTGIVGLYTDKSYYSFALKTDITLEKLVNNKMANNSDGRNLLFVIRNFWINEEKIYGEKGSRVLIPTKYSIINIQPGPQLLYASKIKCAIDVFILSENKYYPLVRIDTLLNHWKKVNEASCELIEDVFNLINKKITHNIYEKRYLKRTASSKENIIENYDKDFSFPLIKDSIIKRGIYYSWNQLKNNQPDEKEFRIQINKKERPTFFTKSDNGVEETPKGVFALSDGTNTYKVNDGYVFDLYRQQRAIYWIDIVNFDFQTQKLPFITALRPVISAKSGNIIPVKKNKLIPHLLDLESGKEL